MTKINIQEKGILTYTTMFFNNHKIEKKPKYKELLQNKLHIFNELLCNFFPTAFKFFIEHFKNIDEDEITQYEYGLMDDILQEYKLQWKNGAPLINDMINELNVKEIDKEVFEYLMSIIDHQEKMTHKILIKDLSLDRIEFIFNHIKNAPFYLKSYLDISKLPNSQAEDTPNKSVKSNWRKDLIIYDYSSQVNGKIYSIGA